MAARFKSGMGKEVKAHHILVLLLRLRQVSQSEMMFFGCFLKGMH